MPPQFVGNRNVARGDVVVAVITPRFWEHPGQVLRSFAVDEDPPTLYRELHEVADAAFDAVATVLKVGATPPQVIEASRVIEDAGFTIIDDLLHGLAAVICADPRHQPPAERPCAGGAVRRSTRPW